jgi:hypothetical protein
VLVSEAVVLDRSVVGRGAAHLQGSVLSLRSLCPGKVRQRPVHYITNDSRNMVEQNTFYLQLWAFDGRGNVLYGSVARVARLHVLGDAEEVLT